MAGIEAGGPDDGVDFVGRSLRIDEAIGVDRSNSASDGLDVGARHGRIVVAAEQRTFAAEAVVGGEDAPQMRVLHLAVKVVAPDGFLLGDQRAVHGEARFGYPLELAEPLLTSFP